MNTAVQARDDGMERATAHADAVSDRWRVNALAAVVDYITRDLFVEDFTAEDVREWARLPEPPDRRAWGTIMVVAARKGYIAKAGYRPHRDPSRHHGVSTVWRKPL